ncbi:HrpA-like RNA helicase [Pseudomonas syringae pv. actinidiae]|uniref:HrpA-like RNA helicase n=1 Tax=Pseudomonas syringae pv. actinidiae TaxID=103796 RepID=A0A2V0QDM0_PSESF|nr:HrpA-like RNA helicase [Pseudomonas syringae pv. actinidiae]
MVGVIPEIQFFQLDHQSAQLSDTERCTLPQNPIVTHDFSDQTGAVRDEIPLVTLTRVEPWNSVVGTCQHGVL